MPIYCHITLRENKKPSSIAHTFFFPLTYYPTFSPQSLPKKSLNAKHNIKYNSPHGETKNELIWKVG